MQNGDVGYWFEDAGLGRTRPELDHDAHADVVFVGAGFSSLWSAYYLSRADPSLKIVILESEFVGFGASGRNGGHVNYHLPGLERLYKKDHSAAKVDEFQNEIMRSIDEVVRVAGVENIQADVEKKGTTTVARNAAQFERLRQMAEHGNASTGVDYGYELLSASEVKNYINMDGALGGVWNPHCARVQPAKLAKGLGEVVEGRGVTIYEGTRVHSIEPRLVVTDKGLRVKGRYIVRATEGFTPSLDGQKRTWLPKLSPQIITAPLDDATIAEVWPAATMGADAGHMFCYMQRTADNRIAVGGPGVPYYWGSKTDDRGYTERSSIKDLTRKLHTFFPTLANTEITHAWTGVLGVPRDWSATVSLDEASGLGVIGGFVGSGVSGTNLAGRTMTELITGRKTSLATLPWVNRGIRKWEIEPVRWIALRGLYKAYVVADALEDRSSSGRTSIVAKSAGWISGRY